jgi:hypothetical protein
MEEELGWPQSLRVTGTWELVVLPVRLIVKIKRDSKGGVGRNAARLVVMVLLQQEGAVARVLQVIEGTSGHARTFARKHCVF